MKNLFTLLIFSLCLTACRKDAPAPSIADGQCEFKRTGHSTREFAQNALNKIKNILTNSQIGNSVVTISRANTFASVVRAGKAKEWGYQVVFSCDNAGVVYESKKFTNDEKGRNTAYNLRVSEINSTAGLKLLESGTSYGSDSCTDNDGNSYNCGDDYYYYDITYVKVNSQNSDQADMIDYYNSVNYVTNAVTGSKFTLSDTLKLATTVLPEHESKIALDYKKLLEKLKNSK